MDSEGKQEINLSHFKDFPKVRLVRIDGCVVTYERLYENLPTFIPLRNNTKDEVERCVIQLKIGEKRDQIKRQIHVGVYRHFPSGTDYSRDEVVNPNPDRSYAPFTELTNDSDFFYEEWSGLIFEKGKRSGISIPNFLNRMYRVHILPTRRWRGSYARRRRLIASGFGDFVERTAPEIYKWLKIICGKQIEFPVTVEGHRQRMHMVPIFSSQVKSIPELVIKTPFGIETTKPIAIWAPITILAMIFLLYQFGEIDKNSVFWVAISMIAFLIFVVFDFVIPLVLLWVLNWLIKRQYKTGYTIRM